MREETMKIQDIFDGSDKAELFEKVGDLLEKPGSKCVVIGGIPDDSSGGIDIAIYQIGFEYLYEILGFMNTAYDIAEVCVAKEDEP